MFAIIAFIPIIVTIIVMAGFNWPAKIALPLARQKSNIYSIKFVKNAIVIPIYFV